MTDLQTTVLRFEPGAVSLSQVDREITELLTQLSDANSSLGRAATDEGFSPGDFIGASATVSQDGKGFGLEVIIVAILVKLTTHAAEKAWDQLIWPRIMDKLGADALGDKVSEDASSVEDASSTED